MTLTTQLSLQSKVLLIVLAKEHGVQIMTTPRTVSIPLVTPYGEKTRRAR
jgi:hypothetical protein